MPRIRVVKLRSHGISNWNVTVVKQTSITERSRLEFRAEFFNLFNHVQFADPGTALGNPQFGIVTATMNQVLTASMGSLPDGRGSVAV